MLSKEDLLKTILSSYENISDLIKSFSKEEIIEKVCEIIEIEQLKLKNLYVRGYTKSKNRAVYGYVITDLFKNINNYDWVYQHLEDQISKEIFTDLVRYRVIPDEQFLEEANRKSKKSFIELDKAGENFTLIKEDAVASAVSAVVNEKETIKNNYSNYVISVHNVVSDLWVIPMMTDAIRKDYSYYIRHYEAEGTGKTLFYIVPHKISKREPVKIHRVVAMAPYERPWSNVELIKDCGLIPYLFYKNHGCDVSMVCAKGGEYPYAEYVKGMKLEFLENGKVGTKIEYILTNGSSIDCLILRGCYATNFGVAAAYKYVNPKGKIYVGLDANSHWMDRILWDEENFVSFMNCCDVIATSCTAMQKHLNEKWPWDIKYVPNGYYNFSPKKEVGTEYSNKENIILTVGRLGTIQKATEILLESFALIADKIPDWKLRLVGNIEKGFQEKIGLFYQKNPQLTDRVIFTGNIKERSKLKQEYEQAKIFALPSRREGGTPNVIAEALHAGCVIAVTKIDAYEDAIGISTDKDNICGKAASINNVEGFSKILLELCIQEDLQKLSQNAMKRAEEIYDMEKIVGKLYEQLCI